MSDFDPVPQEHLLPSEVAHRFIPVTFVSGGDATARELALQVLVDEDPNRQPEIKMFQQGGRGNIPNFFRFMHDTIDSGAGRHAQHILAVACLYPEREARLDIVNATEAYLTAHGSQKAEVFDVSVLFMGSLSIDAFIEAEENEEKVKRGELYQGSSPLNNS